MADIGGDKGFWTAARSRKRKATEQEHRGRDRSDGTADYRRTATGNRQAGLQVSGRGFLGEQRGRSAEDGMGWNGAGSFSNKVGGRIASSEWHGAVESANHPGYKASFYVTNFPENLPLFRLRQAFEVCGILFDVFVARHRNVRGQEFVFVRYVNVKNKIKLSQALNNVWIGEHRVWAREARYDRFERYDSVAFIRKDAVRTEPVGVRHLRARKEEGDKAFTLAKTALEKQRGGQSMVQIGKVEVSVGGGGKKLKVGKAFDGDGGATAASREEGRGNDGTVVVGEATGGRMTQQHEKGKEKELAHAAAVVVHSDAPFHFVPVYNSDVEDRKWATSGMIVTVHVGDSVVALQQRIVDAGFPYVTVTPMGGGDKVFLNCSGKKIFGRCFMRQLIFSPCFFQALLSGRWRRFDMNEGHGCEYMELQFMHGMRISSVYVFPVMGDLFTPTNARSIRLAWILHAFLFQRQIWRF